MILSSVINILDDLDFDMVDLYKSFGFSASDNVFRVQLPPKKLQKREQLYKGLSHLVFVALDEHLNGYGPVLEKHFFETFAEYATKQLYVASDDAIEVTRRNLRTITVTPYHQSLTKFSKQCTERRIYSIPLRDILPFSTFRVDASNELFYKEHASSINYAKELVVK